MKKITLILTMLVCSILAFAQTDAIDDLYDKYEDDCLSIDINVPNWIKNAIADDVGSARHAIKKAKRFKLLVIEDHRDWPSDFSRAKRSLRSSRYDELMTIRDDGELSLYLSEGKDELGLREMIFFINGEDNDGILLSLKGTFNKEDVESILDDIHIDCN